MIIIPNRALWGMATSNATQSRYIVIGVRRKAAIEFVTKGLQTGALKPVIDRTFTFDEMADVHRYLEQNAQFGKIVVTV
jgi:NADPH:quinone reductase-like Zn-dependent oxidoreductase